MAVDVNEIARLSGLFNQQVTNGSYTNPNGNTVSFHVLDNQKVPLESYVAGEIDTYNLFNGASAKDGNRGLYNTTLAQQMIDETIERKVQIVRVPYANYDIIVDCGTGSQLLVFTVVFCGTMYQTAWHNLIAVLFDNKKKGNGILTHPFVGEIKDVLPIKVSNAYTYEALNCISHKITFCTSNIKHLVSDIFTDSKLSEIGKYYSGIQSGIKSIFGLRSALKGLKNDIL
jgi:hypothetical protein